MIWTDYDTANRPETTTIQDASGNLLYRTTLSYDNLEHVGSLKENVAGANYATSYSYDWDDRATEIRYGDSAHRVRYGYDGQGRLLTRRVTNGSADQTSTYSYLGSSVAIPGLSTASSTNLVSGISQPLVSFAYGYAGNTDNIVSETRTGGSYAGTTTYEYDSLGQLIRVNDPAEGTTRVYRYDLGGNMTGQTKYAYTTGTPGEAQETITYSYSDANWKDKLTGSTISAIGSYDAIGNLLEYNGWVYEWEAGRQLKRQVQNGETDVRYEYDQNGMRVRKTVNGIATNYTYSGTQLVHLTKNSDSLHFYYDGQGKPALVSHNGVTYSYLYNLQGDVIGLVDSAGSLVVEYKYNAWGSITGRAGSLAETLGKLNPFRYRGYVYDEETWMYWLKSRYYYPEMQRFISADVVVGKVGSVNGHNLYAYCLNDPVAHSDAAGYLTVSILYDARPNSNDKDVRGGFVEQAEYYKGVYEVWGFDVSMYGYRKMGDQEGGFISQWNSMDDEMDYVIIIGHGAPGSIDAEGTSLCALPKGGREYSFDMLDDKVVHMGCLLYTCNGATPSPITGLSAAEEISRKTGNSMVQALYYAKTLWLANRFLIARRDQKRREDDDVSFWAPLFKMVQYHD